MVYRGGQVYDLLRKLQAEKPQSEVSFRLEGEREEHKGDDDGAFEIFGQAGDLPYFITNLVNIVNDAYAEGEAGMWEAEDQKRTDYKEMERLLQEDKLMIAYPSEDIPHEVQQNILELNQTVDFEQAIEVLLGWKNGKALI